MNSLMGKLLVEAKVLAVFSANKDDNMDIGNIKCLGERQ